MPNMANVVFDTKGDVKKMERALREGATVDDTSRADVRIGGMGGMRGGDGSGSDMARGEKKGSTSAVHRAAPIGGFVCLATRPQRSGMRTRALPEEA